MHRKHRIPILSSCHTRKKRQLRKIDNISHSIPRLSYLSLSKHNSSYYGIPIGCSIALLLLGIISINPIIYNSIYALEDNNPTEEVLDEELEDPEEIEDIEETESSNEELASNAGIATLSDEDNDSSAALIVDDGIIYDTILADAGSPVYKSHTITIKAANLESYVLQVSATNQGTSELVNRDNSSYKVAGVGTSGVLGKNIPSGKWGIGWGATTTSDENLTYYTLPAYGTTASSISTGKLESVSNLDGADVNSTKKLTLAANFSPDTVDGHYTTSLLLSLVVEPKVVSGIGFAGYTYMQDMTTSRCASIPTGTEGRLIDNRDNKVYWVAKIKNSRNDDALCWMTQNLDYDGGSTGNAKLYPGTVFNSSTYSIKQYYDPGEYVFTLSNSNISASCNSNTTEGLTNCEEWKKLPISVMTDTTLPQTSAETLELHYLAGNYYNWTAATNGTNSSVTDGQNASGSICPTNWQLPLGTVSDNTANGSFYAFISGLNMLTQKPHYFVKSGVVYNGTSFFASYSGEYWTSKAYTSTSAYFLSFSTTISPSISNNNYGERGMSIRCVVR